MAYPLSVLVTVIIGSCRPLLLSIGIVLLSHPKLDVFVVDFPLLRYQLKCCSLFTSVTSYSRLPVNSYNASVSPCQCNSDIATLNSSSFHWEVQKLNSSSSSLVKSFSNTNRWYWAVIKMQTMQVTRVSEWFVALRRRGHFLTITRRNRSSARCKDHNLGRIGLELSNVDQCTSLTWITNV